MPYSITFDELIARFGEISAWHYLVEIERAASIRPQHSISNPERRLAAALKAQDAMYASDLHIPLAA